MGDGCCKERSSKGLWQCLVQSRMGREGRICKPSMYTWLLLNQISQLLGELGPWGQVLDWCLNSNSSSGALSSLFSRPDQNKSGNVMVAGAPGDDYSITFFNFPQMASLSGQGEALLEGLGHPRVSTELLVMASPSSSGRRRSWLI